MDLQQFIEVAQAALDGKPVECRADEGIPWHTFKDSPSILIDFLQTGYEFRLKPEPKTRPWSKPEDVPLVCWLRWIGSDEIRLITGVSATRGLIANNISIGGWLSWENLSGVEYSTDRVTWKACEVVE